MNGKKRKTAVIAIAAVFSVMTIASPLAVMAQEAAPNVPAVTRDGNVQKETAPAIRLPKNLQAKAGTALKDVALPEHWTWEDDSRVITAETAEYPAQLFVDDAAYDYSKVEGYNAGGHYVERMVAVIAEAAKAGAADPVKGKPRRLPGDTPVTYDAGEIAIDETNFPDAEFRAYIKSNFDQNNSGSLSAAEIADITKIEVNNKHSIQDLTGIEYFTALTGLYCYSTGLVSLDVSRNTELKTLACYNTGLGSLDVSSNTKLETLACDNTEIESLDVSHNMVLRVLKCSNTGLVSLNVSNNVKLTELYCSDNEKFTSLNVNGAKALQILNCSSNTGLGVLDVSNNVKLRELYCYSTGIGSLDVSSNTALSILDCANNTGLRSLDVSNNMGLRVLKCSNTGLVSLNVSSNAELDTLICQSNTGLGNLNVENNPRLATLICNSTGLRSLNVSSNKALTNLSCNNTGLVSLDVSSNTALEHLKCTNTGLVSLDVSSNTALQELRCNDNASLISLKADGATALRYLDCYNTGLVSLDVSSNKTLQELNCRNTGIRSLDVSSNTNLSYLDCSNNPLAYLKIGTNNKLTTIKKDGLKPVGVTVTSGSFKMADKFVGIEVSAVDNVQGADYDSTSGTMSNYSGGTPITYTYHCGTSSGGTEETIGVALNLTDTRKESSISVTANLDKTYDGKAVSATPAVNRTGSDGAVSYKWERSKNAANWEKIPSAPADAGTYRVTAALASNDTHQGATSTPVPFTISQAASSISVTANLDKTYDGKAVNATPAVNRTGSGGAVSYKWEQKENAGGWTLIPSAPTDAGTYRVTAALASDDNYKGATSTPVPFTISQAESSISVTANLNKAYDGKAVSAKPEVDKTGSGGTVSYKWERNKNSADWEEITSAPTDAGTYRVTAALASDDNYKGATSKPVPFTISQAESSISVTANLNKAYDGKAVSAEPKVDKTGSGGTVSYKWERNKNSADWEEITSAPTDARTYRVTAALESDDNYKGATSKPVPFTISKAANGWTGTLSITGWTYGKTPNDPTAAAKFGKASYIYSNREHGNYTDSVPSHAGRWYVKAVVAGTDNYEGLESDAVPFVIAPKGITTDSQITVPDITADTDLDELVIQDGDQVLVQGTDYDVTKTRDGAKVTVVITGKGNYTGTITRTYTVEEKAPSGGVKGPDNNNDGKKTDKKAAQTGDPTNIGLLAAMILLSAGCMFFLIRKKGHKK